MNLYFTDKNTTITTILLIGLVVYMVYLVKNNEKIKSWGRRIFLLIIWGLEICCTAAVRDGLVDTIQNAIDGSTAPGLFKLISLPTIVGAIGAALILFSGIAALFMRKQSTRKILCYICMSGITLKIALIELSRIIIWLGAIR